MKRRNYIVNRNLASWPPRFAVVVGGVARAENLPDYFEAYELLCRLTGRRYKDAYVERECDEARAVQPLPNMCSPVASSGWDYSRRTEE